MKNEWCSVVDEHVSFPAMIGSDYGIVVFFKCYVYKKREVLHHENVITKK